MVPEVGSSRKSLESRAEHIRPDCLQEARHKLPSNPGFPVQGVLPEKGTSMLVVWSGPGGPRDPFQCPSGFRGYGTSSCRKTAFPKFGTGVCRCCNPAGPRKTPKRPSAKPRSYETESRRATTLFGASWSMPTMRTRLPQKTFKAAVGESPQIRNIIMSKNNLSTSLGWTGACRGCGPGGPRKPSKWPSRQPRNYDA